MVMRDLLTQLEGTKQVPIVFLGSALEAINAEKSRNWVTSPRPRRSIGASAWSVMGFRVSAGSGGMRKACLVPGCVTSRVALINLWARRKHGRETDGTNCFHGRGAVLLAVCSLGLIPNSSQ